MSYYVQSTTTIPLKAASKTEAMKNCALRRLNSVGTVATPIALMFERVLGCTVLLAGKLFERVRS